MKKFVLFLPLILACVVSRGATAAEPPVPVTWEFAGWYGGGCFPNVEFDPNVEGRMYLASDVAGIWRSDNGGERWEPINNGLDDFHVACLAVAPSDSNIVYTGTKKGVFRSDDAGRNWVSREDERKRISLRRPLNHRGLAVFPSDPQKLVLGDYEGRVFFSSDGGALWRALGSREKPLGSAPVSSVVLAAGEERLYVCSVKGAAVYSFKDKTWSILAGAPKNAKDLLIFPKSGVLYMAAGKKIHVSEDGGSSWKSSEVLPYGYAERIAFLSKEDPARFVVACNEGWGTKLFVTSDGGKTWTETGKKMKKDEVLNPTRAWTGLDSRVTSLKADPFASSRLFRTDWWGVWRSDDEGFSWTEKINGAANVVASDIVFSEAGELYAATMDNGLLKSADEGRSFEAIFPRKKYDRSVNGHVWRVALPAEGRVVATSSPWNDPINQVALSADGGASFTRSGRGLPAKRPAVNTMWGDGYPRAIALDPKNPNKLYLGIDGDDGGGLFISHDGGRNWQRSQGQPGALRLYNALGVDPSDPRILYWGAFGKGGGMYVSEDGGETWAHTLKSERRVFDLAVSSKGTVVAGVESERAALYISKDRGRTWDLLKEFPEKGTCEGLMFHPKLPSVLAASTMRWDDRAGYGLYLSLDEGKSWIDISGNLTGKRGAAAMAFHPTKPHLYIAQYAGSVYKADLSRILQGIPPENA